MKFSYLVFIFTLLMPTSYGIADSQIQLSSDIVVEQFQKTVKANVSYFKNKDNNDKYIRIRNAGISYPLILSLPDINFDVAIKNEHGLLPSEGKDFVWVEPGSVVVLHIKEGAKFYDFIPVVYMVNKTTPKVLSVIAGKEISAAKELKLVNYKEPHSLVRLKSTQKITDIIDLDKISTLKKGYYNVKVSQFANLEFDKEIYIISRNGMIAGSQYFTNNLVVYPNEKIILMINGDTHVKK